MAHVALTLQLTVGGTFLLAGMAKLRRPKEIRAIVSSLSARVGICSPLISSAAAWALITAEIAAGSTVLARAWLGDVGLVLAAVLLLTFTGLAIASAAGVVKLSCACFGRALTVLGWRHVFRNSLLLGMAAVVIASPEPPADFGSLAVSAMAALVLTAIIASLDAIVDLYSLPTRPSRSA